jgi:hypothetical protein
MFGFIVRAVIDNQDLFFNINGFDPAQKDTQSGRFVVNRNDYG